MGALGTMQPRPLVDDPGAGPAGVAAAVGQPFLQAGLDRCRQLGCLLRRDLPAGMQRIEVRDVAMARLGLDDLAIPLEQPTVRADLQRRQSLAQGVPFGGQIFVDTQRSRGLGTVAEQLADNGQVHGAAASDVAATPRVVQEAVLGRGRGASGSDGRRRPRSGNRDRTAPPRASADRRDPRESARRPKSGNAPTDAGRASRLQWARWRIAGCPRRRRPAWPCARCRCCGVPPSRDSHRAPAPCDRRRRIALRSDRTRACVAHSGWCSQPASSSSRR